MDMNFNLHDIESDWTKASITIKETAEKELGTQQNKKNKWFNEICRKAIEKRKLTRDKYLMLQNQIIKETYERERQICRHILQREKQNFLNGLLEEAEKNCSQGNSRNFFRIIKKHQRFNRSQRAIKNTEGSILMEPKKSAERWKSNSIVIYQQTPWKRQFIK